MNLERKRHFLHKFYMIETVSILSCIHMKLTVISSFFMLIPLWVFFYHTYHPPWEIGLALLLVINFILSMLFWTRPIQHSMYHRMDAIFAKLSYLLFTVYIFFIKKITYRMKLLFLILLLLSSILFYLSNSYSVNWCSTRHVVCHSLFHFISSIGASIAFI